MPESRLKAICPKCGKEGIQVIKITDKNHPERKYLRYYHGEKYCYIGRVRTTEEAMGEIEKPQSTEEYEEALANIIRELKELIAHYSSSGTGSVQSIIRRLKAITDRYNL